MNLTAYVLRRLLFLVPTALGVVTVLFLMLRVVPGDVSDTILAAADVNPKESARLKVLIREEAGLDKPFTYQYVQMLGQLARGNLGFSFTSGKPVTQIVRERLPWSASLAAMGTALGVLIAVPLGLFAAFNHRKGADQVLLVLSAVLISAPGFVLGLLAVYVLSSFFGWAPASPPSLSIAQNPVGSLSVLAAPAIILGVHMSAPVFRLVRGQALDAVGGDYARTARSKGLAEATVRFRHVMPNILGPALTYGGVLFARGLVGVVVIETIFLVPGVGTAIINAITSRDYQVTQGLIFGLSFFVLVVNLVIDFSLLKLDPRISHS